MEQTRQVAYRLAAEGQLNVLKRQKVVKLDDLKNVSGPIRLKLCMVKGHS